MFDGRVLGPGGVVSAGAHSGNRAIESIFENAVGPMASEYSHTAQRCPGRPREVVVDTEGHRPVPNLVAGHPGLSVIGFAMMTKRVCGSHARYRYKPLARQTQAERPDHKKRFVWRLQFTGKLDR